MSHVRVRFAPSPTGFFHIGSARTALFNWLYARHTGGTFVLRIEDTDKERNSEAFLNVIYDSLRWLGMDWDEGPGKGGDFGPYRQSERDAVYREYLAKLTAAGRTYEKDGAIWFKLLGERYEVFDEHRKKTVTKVKTAPSVIDDLIRGRVERVEDEDFVIFRSDGNPVFHFVNVVDDIAMQITHVIRGEDHLSNTSKHVELFKAFGAPMPRFAHIPLILKQNGPGKMSKRDQGALIEEYQRRGYLPEALVNFLSLLGWNPGDDREIMSIEEIIRLFDLPGVNQSNARFDEKKLAHMNTEYLKKISAERYVERVSDYYRSRILRLESLPQQTDAARANLAVYRKALADPEYFQQVMLLVRDKYLDTGARNADRDVEADIRQTEPDRSIASLFSYTAYFFVDDFYVDAKVRDKVMGKGDPKARLRELGEALSGFDFTSDSAIEEGIKGLATKNGLGFGDYQAVARLAVSGTNVGPSITGMFRVLGRDKVRARFERLLAS